MVLRSLVAASVGAVLKAGSKDKKDEPTTTMEPYRRDYGAAAHSERERRPFMSTSRSGERLDRVPEAIDDSLSVEDNGPSSWNNEQDYGDECHDEEEDWDDQPYNYERSLRQYALVPVVSALFILFAAFLPELIAPHTPTPSTLRIVLSIILSASLWCLAHSLRVPLYSLLKSIIIGIFYLVSSAFYLKRRRTTRHAGAAYADTVTSIVHVFIFVFLQESLRVASFAILDLRWHESNTPPAPRRRRQLRAHSSVFREVWALALGWAIAEIFAGVLQGYEQLQLYAEPDAPEIPVEAAGGGEDDGGIEESISTATQDVEAVGLLSRTMPCIEPDDDDIEAARSSTQTEIELALSRLATVRAREEIEELYGQPYIEVPVFIPLLQRLDSLLLSLGITLLLAAAYLPKPPSVSSFISSSPPSLSSQSALHTHMIPLLPTYFLVASLHAILGVLHAPPILARIGLPAAAYTSCILGLALTFAGVGVWFGVW